MAQFTLAGFADAVCEIMPVIAKEFLRRQTGEFYKMKLTVPQFVVLELLHRQGESKMTDLAHSLNVTTAAMTGIADRLVRDGYVTRTHDTDDRRIVNIKLTAKGNKVVETAADQRKHMIMKIFGMISQAERESYIKILRHISNHIKNQKGDASE